MGHMKQLLAIGIFALSLLFAPAVAAHEGQLDLSGSGVSCKGISLYQSGYYRVSGRCDGLVYPHETTYNKYVIWGRTTARGEMIRIGEVDRGYFSGNIASPFDQALITAEADGLVRRPSDRIVVRGSVVIFDFDKSRVSTTPAPSVAPTGSTTGVTVQDGSETRESTTGSVIGRILTSLLVIVLVIVAIVIGASLIFRNRGSVSR
jgi:hypothetical protein